MISGLGRSPEERKGYPLQYSGLENSMDCIVQEVAELDMTERLSLHNKNGLVLNKMEKRKIVAIKSYQSYIYNASD